MAAKLNEILAAYDKFCDSAFDAQNSGHVLMAAKYEYEARILALRMSEIRTAALIGSAILPKTGITLIDVPSILKD